MLYFNCLIWDKKEWAFLENNKIISILQKSALFSHAEFSHLESFVLRDDCQTIHLREAETLKNSTRALCVLLKGSAEVHSTDTEKTVILRLLKAGDVFGAAALFCQDPQPISTIVAVEPSEILLFTESAVRELIEQDRTVMNAYLKFLSDRVCFLNRKIACFTAGTALRRLALWLAAEEHDEIILPASLSVFSDMLDIGRASLYRAFDSLEENGLIKKEGRRIRILNRERLLLQCNK